MTSYSWITRSLGFVRGLVARSIGNMGAPVIARPRLLEPLESRLLLDGNANLVFAGIETNFDAGLEEIGNAIQEIIEVEGIFDAHLPGVMYPGTDETSTSPTIRELFQHQLESSEGVENSFLAEIAGEDGTVSFKDYFVNVFRDRIDSFIDNWDPLAEDPEGLEDDGLQFVNDLAAFFGSSEIDDDTFGGESVEEFINLDVSSLGHSNHGSEATWSIGFSLNFSHDLVVNAINNSDDLNLTDDNLARVNAAIGFGVTLGYDADHREFSYTPDTDLTFSIGAELPDGSDLELLILSLEFTEADVNTAIQLMTSSESPFDDQKIVNSVGFTEALTIDEHLSSSVQSIADENQNFEHDSDASLDSIIVPIDLVLAEIDDDLVVDGLVIDLNGALQEDADIPSAESSDVEIPGQDEAQSDGTSEKSGESDTSEVDVSDDTFSSSTVLLDASLESGSEASDNLGGFASTPVLIPDDIYAENTEANVSATTHHEASVSLIDAFDEISIRDDSLLTEEYTDDELAVIDEAVTLTGIVALASQSTRSELE